MKKKIRLKMVKIKIHIHTNFKKCIDFIKFIFYFLKVKISNHGFKFIIKVKGGFNKKNSSKFGVM